MDISIKIAWSSYKPSVPYLRLLAGLRNHAVYIAVPISALIRLRDRDPGDDGHRRRVQGIPAKEGFLTSSDERDRFMLHRSPPFANSSGRSLPS